MTSRSPSPGPDRPRRRGRPPDSEREQRRAAVLDAAFAELLEHGADGVTMASIAQRAHASKETLYSWFGSRDGLFSAMITANADAASARVDAALADAGDPAETLRSFGAGLLRLLTDPRSVALNRAAMSNPALAAELLASGRHRVGPIVERYLAEVTRAGALRVDDPAEAFELFYGLLVRDTQIRVLLGEPAPSATTVERRADAATDQFVALLHDAVG